MAELEIVIILAVLFIATLVILILMTRRAVKYLDEILKLEDKIETMQAETAKEILQIIDMRAKDICFDTNEEQFAVCHTVDELKQAITDKYGVEVKE